jgi:hypothetical protein
MMESTMSERLEMRWLPVVDASGRTRMEASWIPVSTGNAAEQPAITHAA